MFEIRWKQITNFFLRIIQTSIFHQKLVTNIFSRSYYIRNVFLHTYGFNKKLKKTGDHITKAPEICEYVN